MTAGAVHQLMILLSLILCSLEAHIDSHPSSSQKGQQTHPPRHTTTHSDGNFIKREYSSENEEYNNNGTADDDGRFLGPFDTRGQKGLEVDDTIRFPAEKKKRECIHGLCFNTPSYPRQKILKLLDSPRYNQLEFPDEKVDIDLGNRFKSDEFSLCDAKVHSIIFPEMARNTMDVERTIVNVEGRKQGVEVEVCANENKECMFSKSFPLGYKTRCAQKQSIKKLMVYDNDKIVPDFFPVPSCCLCMVKKIN